MCLTVATEEVVEFALDILRFTAGGREGTFIFRLTDCQSEVESSGHSFMSQASRVPWK